MLWIGCALGAVTVTYATFYVTIQQTIRQGANQPQVQLAHDTANSIVNGRYQAAIATSIKTDIASSLAPFVMIYDDNANLVASGAVLDGANPVVPPGVIKAATENHDHRVTWQPRGGVRIAAVVVKYPNGYVLAGRSLSEVEKLEDHVLQLVALGWLVTMALILVTTIYTIDPKGRG